MKKYLLLMFFLFFWSCEDENSGNDVIFKVTDTQHYSENFVIFIHHSDNPDSDALAKVQVEKGGTATFTENKIEGGPFFGSNQLDIDLSSIDNDFIVTIYQLNDNPDIRRSIITNWNVKKGSEWNITGLYDNYNEAGISDQMISDPISPVAGSDISDVLFEQLASGYKTSGNEGYCGDISNSWSSFYANTSSSDQFNYIIGLQLEDGSKHLGTANVDWETCGSISATNWIQDALFELEVPFDISFDTDRVVGYIRNYNTISGKGNQYYETDYQRLHPDDSGFSTNVIDLLTTDQVSFANKKYLNISARRTDGIYGYSGTRYYDNYTDGNVVDVRDLTFNFDHNEETGALTNITAENEIDQLSFTYTVNINDILFFWTHYLDPKHVNQISLPKLDIDLVNNLEWGYAPQAYSYDVYEGQDEVLNALRVENTWYQTPKTYRWSWYSHPWTETSMNSENENDKNQKSLDKVWD